MFEFTSEQESCNFTVRKTSDLTGESMKGKRDNKREAMSGRVALVTVLKVCL